MTKTKMIKIAAPILIAITTSTITGILAYQVGKAKGRVEGGNAVRTAANLFYPDFDHKMERMIHHGSH